MMVYILVNLEHGWDNILGAFSTKENASKCMLGGDYDLEKDKLVWEYGRCFYDVWVIFEKEIDPEIEED